MTARALTKALRGQWHGSYGTARCPAHDDKNPSLSITERADGRLLTHCHANCEPAAVWDALQQQGLVANDRGTTRRRLRQVSKASQAERLSEESHAAIHPDRRAAALSIWRTSHPTTETPVAAYLAARGITTPIPLSLRYHPMLKHGPTGLHFPAMVAAVQALDRRITGIHRTFLLPGGSGKAQVSEPKMAFGPIGDGAVRLSARAKVLGIAEGIETALSAQQLFEIPCWAALGARMDKVTLPADVIEVQIFGDNGKEGHEATEKARDVFTKAGKRVAVRRPPEGFSDWNDALPHWHERSAGDWEF